MSDTGNIKLMPQQERFSLLPQKQVVMSKPTIAMEALNGTKAKNPISAREMAHIDAAAQDFEASFLTEMLRPMFEEINKPDPVFGGGKGEEIFNGMMIDQYGKIMAKAGGVGMARYVKSEMIRIQEEARNK